MNLEKVKLSHFQSDANWVLSKMSVKSDVKLGCMIWWTLVPLKSSQISKFRPWVMNQGSWVITLVVSEDTKQKSQDRNEEHICYSKTRRIRRPSFSNLRPSQEISPQLALFHRQFEVKHSPSRIITIIVNKFKVIFYLDMISRMKKE